MLPLAPTLPLPKRLRYGVPGGPEAWHMEVLEPGICPGAVVGRNLLPNCNIGSNEEPWEVLGALDISLWSAA